MSSIDTGRVLEALLIAFVGGGVSWVFWQTKRNAKDINAAFREIRYINERLKEKGVEYEGHDSGIHSREGI
jgi:hypothetical protein